ncbi:MAG: restriction endonuclease [Chloroflexi bacterium]|nr:restriction endonuclease [Chloroflexota bacterium]
MKDLTIEYIKLEAGKFLRDLSSHGVDTLFGITDGKTVGTYVEHEFHSFLRTNYRYEVGSSARGIDFPALGIDLKVTLHRQPQSSCPFRTADQKVYGLGYHLMVFVYDKRDDSETETAYLNFSDAIFIEEDRTGDYQTTKGLIDILSNDANLDDIDTFLQERNLPLDEIGRRHLANRIVETWPLQGYITISNALQWRLQYSWSIEYAGKVDGVESLL